MHKQDDSQQNAELRQAFLRHLPKRLDTLTRRGLRQARDGWDINTLSLIFREVQTLAGASGRYGLLDLAEKLYAIETALAEKVEQVALPDEILTEHIVRLLEDLQELTCGLIASAPAAAIAATDDVDR
ncbi:MAG TPA: Hpt domain-containing protein, partial [Tahibacter sp.]|nr:Hpt domain-containing protein [Tahibacter sp.]